MNLWIFNQYEDLCCIFTDSLIVERDSIPCFQLLNLSCIKREWFNSLNLFSHFRFSTCCRWIFSVLFYLGENNYLHKCICCSAFDVPWTMWGYYVGSSCIWLCCTELSVCCLWVFKLGVFASWGCECEIFLFMKG